MLDNKDDNNIMVIFIELKVLNIFGPGRVKLPILPPPPMEAHVYTL